jgi:hypothetical protein
MASLRLPAVTTSTTAVGTSTGYLALATTVGITRHAVLQVTAAGGGDGGWLLQVDSIVDGTHLIARQCGFIADSPVNPGVRNPQNLSIIPNGAVVVMPEQWVADLYSDDAPDSLSIPTK